ncbi:MAG: hypothetical protein ACRD1R_20000 [Acidobacteriota bacterium]
MPTRVPAWVSGLAGLGLVAVTPALKLGGAPAPPPPLPGNKA